MTSIIKLRLAMMGGSSLLKLEARYQVGTTQPCWTAETSGEVAVEKGTNTRVTNSGSGTAVHAAHAVHARLHQHTQGWGREGEQDEDKK